MTKSINGFNGKYRWLSNFYPSQIEFEGIVYPTVEHAYQAAKSTSHSFRQQIALCTTPGEAKAMGRTAVLRSDWDDVKVVIMQTLLRKKFYDPGLSNLLFMTGEAILEETNYWHDQFWGNCVCKKHRDTPGENWLGKSLMKVREMQDASSSTSD